MDQGQIKTIIEVLKKIEQNQRKANELFEKAHFKKENDDDDT